MVDRLHDYSTHVSKTKWKYVKLFRTISSCDIYSYHKIAHYCTAALVVVTLVALVRTIDFVVTIATCTLYTPLLTRLVFHKMSSRGFLLMTFSQS